MFMTSAGVNTASISPLFYSDIFKNITGPLLTNDVTTRVASTIVNTEQNARQKWNLCLNRSLHWYLAKNLVAAQHFYFVIFS